MMMVVVAVTAIPTSIVAGLTGSQSIQFRCDGFLGVASCMLMLWYSFWSIFFVHVPQHDDSMLSEEAHRDDACARHVVHERAPLLLSTSKGCFPAVVNNMLVIMLVLKARA